jgi:uncharacterized membrane protein YtjA (UPF0391 family)
MMAAIFRRLPLFRGPAQARRQLPVITGTKDSQKGAVMLSWAFSFLVLALIAGFLGFGGIAMISIEMARILFVVFLILFVIAAAAHAFTGKAPPAV